MEFHGTDLTKSAFSAFDPRLGVLTGLSTATATQAAATDTILAAIGKLEARIPRAIILAAAFPSTVVTLANVTGWSFTVTAGQSYKVSVLATYQSAAPGTGGRIGLTTVGAAGTVVGRVDGSIVTTTANSQLHGTLSSLTSNLVTTGVGITNTPVAISLDFVLNCTTSGSIGIQWASEVAASSSQLNAGSALIYQRLS